ncbi:MAG: hypothetical protein JJT85_09600 [Chromatiales bacterium]|nr:hypothetical protein [Chromatiales bacterium]
MQLRQLLLVAAEFLFRMARYRWAALVVTWVVAVAGWVIVASMPNEYRADARVFVDTRSILQPLLGNLTVTPDTISQVRIVAQVLLSRPRLEAVVAQTGLDARAGSPEELESLVARLASNINIVRDRQAEIFTINYRDRDPVMARNVVQALLESFMESSIGKDRADALQAQRFLEQQIRQYEQRLNEAEERRAAFRRANSGLMPGDGGDYFARLRQAEEAVRMMRAEIDAQMERRRELGRQAELVAGGGISDVDGLPSFPTSVDADISRLEQDLTSLRAQFTERHPRVIAVSATLESLYRVRDEERARAAESAAGRGSQLQAGQEVNPVWLELQVALSQADVELAALRSALREREQVVASLRDMIDTMPDVEAQLGRLDRDYNVIRAQYDQLVQRLESARIGEELQVDTEAVKFEIIDPPRIPLRPTGPPRALYYSFVLLLAIGAGGGLAFLLSLHRPVYFMAQRLSGQTGLPIFGRISYSGGHSFSTANMVLFSLPVVLLFLAFFLLQTGILGLAADLRSLF